MSSIDFKTLITKLPVKTYIGTLLATALVYALIDFSPIQKLLPGLEPQIALILWQSLVWALYSIFIAFFLSYSIGVSQNLIKLSFLDFTFTYFTEFIATRLRVVINTTLWSLLFIIPGLVMALRYSLSEMAVFFNPGLLQDRVQDPLVISKNKINFKILTLLFLATLFFILPSTIDSTFDHAHLLYEPGGRIVQIVLYSILNILIYLFLFWSFQNYEEKKNV